MFLCPLSRSYSNGPITSTPAFCSEIKAAISKVGNVELKQRDKKFKNQTDWNETHFCLFSVFSERLYQPQWPIGGIVGHVGLASKTSEALGGS